ncbi:MAG: type II toxin-antitoxin system PemK/MazF family toxin [Acidobacteria bacterium]|nr:type II toxin-antitoxin system PemK/MazF family toxin [Acidobacteriota bacterium]
MRVPGSGKGACLARIPNRSGGTVFAARRGTRSAHPPSVIRGAPSEVVLGAEEGPKEDSAINLDLVQTAEQGRLTRYVGRLSRARMAAVCRALAIAVDCDA